LIPTSKSWTDTLTRGQIAEVLRALRYVRRDDRGRITLDKGVRDYLLRLLKDGNR
jgi:hypothetical protein